MGVFAGWREGPRIAGPLLASVFAIPMGMTNWLHPYVCVVPPGDLALVVHPVNADGGIVNDGEAVPGERHNSVRRRRRKRRGEDFLRHDIRQPVIA